MTGSERGARSRAGWPVWTLALVACALVVELVPGLSGALGFERAAIARGELWRLLTGHLVHEVPQLAVLDLVALALFGAWVERASRRLLGAALLASALASALSVLLFTDFERYIGSSALVSGLVAAAAAWLLRTSPGRAPRLVALTLLALLAAKIALELASAWPAALGGLPAGYEPAAAAHLGGALGGGAAAVAVRE